MTTEGVDRHALKGWVLEALRHIGGAASIVEVCRHVWLTHEAELRASGDLFFTWQYDIRWAAQYLRNSGRLAAVGGDRRKPWELTAEGWAVDLLVVIAEGAGKERK